MARRPKKVKIIYKESIVKIPEYNCPFCHTTFVGGSYKGVLRFKCGQCKNTLIIDDQLKTNNTQWGAIECRTN